MKRSIAKALAMFLIAMQLVTLLAFSTSAATTTRPSATVYKVDTTNMVINGTADAAEGWDDIDWNESLSVWSPITAGNELSFKFKAKWGKDSENAYLYLLIDVADASVLSSATTGYNWTNDSVMVLLDQTGTTSSSVKLQNGSLSIPDGRYNDTVLWAQRSAAGFSSYDNKSGTYKVSEKSDGTGYVVEASIKLADSSAIVDGKTMQMNLQAQNGENGDNKAQALWYIDEAVRGSLNDKNYAAHSGIITFSNDTEKAPATGDNTIWFAVAAAVAMLGTAILVKKVHD